MRLFKQSDEFPTLTFMIKFPHGLRAEQHLTRFEIVVPQDDGRLERKLTCKFFPSSKLLRRFSRAEASEKRHRAVFFVFVFVFHFGLKELSAHKTRRPGRFAVKSQPVPWLLDSKTPFLKNGENSQMACLVRWKPPSASARRGEPEDDSITRNRFLR